VIRRDVALRAFRVGPGPRIVRRSRWGAAAVALACSLLAEPLAAATAEQIRLLADSDPFASAPSELRLELNFSAGPTGAKVPIELWRRGDQLALIRFLAPKDRGKFVIRRENAFWFLSPGAKKPVKLAPALAPSGGSTLDDLLSLRPSRDYTIATVEEASGQVTFDLVAKPGTSGAPKVRWVVDRAKRLPLRAEFRTAEGKVTRLVEFKRWKDPKRLLPAELIAKDVARGGLPLDVEFVALEARPVPEALFDPADGSARAALPPLGAPAATSPP
jgi:hypothetical protein